MKLFYRRLILLFAFLLTPFAFGKYKTAMIFSGGGMQIPMFIGMLDGLEEKGVKPDLLIGTCGGTIAAAIIEAFPHPARRRDFLGSKEFQDFLLSPRFETKRPIRKLIKVISDIKSHYYFGRWWIPNIFDNYLVTLPPFNEFHSRDGLDPIPPSEEGPRIVIVAGQTDFQTEGARPGQRWRGRKLIREAFFTDSETATLLTGFDSAIATQFPDSPIDVKPVVITDQSRNVAVRASVSDPYYFDPFKIGDHYYISGAIDLYPVELAKHLAEEVILTYDSSFDQSIMIPAHSNIVGYNNQVRLRSVVQQDVRTWIDRSDFGTLVNEVGLSPIVVKGKFVSQVPRDLVEFRRIVDAQVEWGKNRATEALEQPRGGRNHIRMPVR